MLGKLFKRRWVNWVLYISGVLFTVVAFSYGAIVAERIWGDELPIILANLKPWLYVWRISMYVVGAYFWMTKWRGLILKKMYRNDRTIAGHEESRKQLRSLEYMVIMIFVLIEAVNLMSLIDVWELL